MKPERFDEVKQQLLDHCNAILDAKRHEYTPGMDRFGNFRSAGLKLQVSPERALWGMRAKQEVNLDEMVRNQDLRGSSYPMELWREKIADDINYLLLLWGLIVERHDPHAMIGRERNGHED